MKRSFYYVHGENTESLGVADAPPQFDNYTIPLDGEVCRWESIELQLRSGSFTDFLSSNVIWHICSLKMRQIVDHFCKHGDGIQWLEVRVTDGRLTRPYYILHLSSAPDTIDKAKTFFEEDGFIRKAVLDPTKLSALHIFRFPDDMVRLVVSEEVKVALENGDCTGMEFTEVPQAAE